MLLGGSPDNVHKACRRRHSFPVVMMESPNSEVITMDPNTVPTTNSTMMVPDKMAHPLQVSVNRPAVHQAGFDNEYDYRQKVPKTCCESITDGLKYEFSKERLKRGLKARFPCVEWMKIYNVKEWLVGDIVSGITIGIMQIPLGMAYALLCGCPPATGLYTSFFSVIIYCFLGTSRHTSQGTFAVISLMFAKTVQTYSTPVGGAATTVMPLLNATMEAIAESSTMAAAAASTTGLPISSTMATAAAAVTYTPIQVASAVAMLVGIMQVIFGFLRLGALNVYMSDTLVSGFTTGAAVLVFTSQFNSFFEIKTPKYSWPFEIVYKYIYIFSHWDKSNVPTIIVSLISIVVLALVAEVINPPFQKKFKVPIPIELTAVVVGTGISYAMDFSGTYKISIVGFIPSGLPVPSVPPTGALATGILGDAFAVAIVSYVIQLSLAKIFAKKHNYEINANQEFIACGASNFFASFFSCFPMCVALSRSMVHDSVGGRTQLAGLISSVVVLIVVLAIAPLFQTLPNCVLAAIIVVAIRRMFLQFRDMAKAWTISKLEAMTWIVTFLSVSLINIDVGLGIGVFFSILTVIWRSQKPHTSVLGMLPDSGLYKDIKRYPMAVEEPGIKIYQFAAPIIFANSKTFRKQMYSKTGVNPRIVLKKMLKQKKRDENETKKRVKRRGSLIPPNPSSESLDILVTRSKVSERLPDGTILSLAERNGHSNQAFESDSASNGGGISFNGLSRSSGLDTMSTSVTMLNIINLDQQHKGGNYANSNGSSSHSNLSTSTTTGYGSSNVSTIGRDMSNGGYAPTSLHHIILDLSCSSFIDSSGVQVIQQVIEEYQKISIIIYLAACPMPIVDMLESSNFYAGVSRDYTFPTLNDAVAHAVYQYSVNNNFYHNRNGLSC